MDLSQVAASPEKDIEAVEFGGGAIWEVAQVEVRQPLQEDCPAVPEPLSEGVAEDEVGEGRGWEVKTSRAARRRQRKNPALCLGLRRGCCREGAPEDSPCATTHCCRSPSTEELQNMVEQRSTEIEAGLNKLWAMEAGMKVASMAEDKFQVEVNETFVGAVTKDSQLMTMTFQVAGVKKALAAVSRICRAGNLVQFGEESSECFIMNKKTKKKVMMKRIRGSYAINVEFVRRIPGSGGDSKLEVIGKEVITVDSGAEESVCPLGWGESFGLQKVKPGHEMRMINAGGGVMPHFGSRKVQFAAADF